MHGNTYNYANSITSQSQKHSTIFKKQMKKSHRSSIRKKNFSLHSTEHLPSNDMKESFEDDYPSLNENQNIRRPNTRHLNPNMWQATMKASFHFLILIVISCMTEFVFASNGSSRNGGVVGGVQRSNSIPQGGPYKNAQSAASVSNIVNGHYQPLEEDEEAPPISILADRY